MDRAAKARFKEFMDSCELSWYDQLEADFQKDEDISKQIRRSGELFNELKKALPQSNISILNEYADVLYEIGIQRGFSFYKFGFSDASELVQMLFCEKKDVKLNIQIV